METELRIGNYIYNGKIDIGISEDDPTLGFWNRVRSIGNIDQDFEQIECETAESFEWVFKDNWRGIPLCEKWLVALGFEKKVDGDIDYYEIKNNGGRSYVVCNNHEEWFFSLLVGNVETILIYGQPFFRYIHHLQNLWFSLTGNELTFNADY